MGAIIMTIDNANFINTVLFCAIWTGCVYYEKKKIDYHWLVLRSTIKIRYITRFELNPPMVFLN